MSELTKNDYEKLMESFMNNGKSTYNSSDEVKVSVKPINKSYNEKNKKKLFYIDKTITTVATIVFVISTILLVHGIIALNENHHCSFCGVYNSITSVLLDGKSSKSTDLDTTEKPKESDYEILPDSYFDNSKSFDNIKEYVKEVYSDNFKNLDPISQAKLLSNILKYEQYILGCNFNIDVKIEQIDVSDNDILTYGYYLSPSHTIVINNQIIQENSPEDVISTLLHEVKHAQQHFYVDFYEDVFSNLSVDNQEKYKSLPIIEYAKAYQTSFYNYVDADEDFSAYKSQLCEVNAEEYADSELQTYHNFAINQGLI